MRFSFILFVIILVTNQIQAFEIEWEHVFDNDDNLKQMHFLQTADNGFLISFHIEGGDDNNDSILFKQYSSNFELIWERNWNLYPELSVRSRYLNKLVNLPDGNYALVGNICPDLDADECDIFIFEFNDDGDSLAYYHYESDVFTAMTSAVALEDGGYMIVAYETRDQNHWDKEYIAIRVDSEGEIVWQETMQRPLPQLEFDDIIIADDGSFIIGGEVYITSPSHLYRGLVMKFDIESNIIWQQMYEIPNIDCNINRILNLDSENYSAIGYFGEYPYWLWFVSFSEDGEELVNKQITNYEINYVWNCIKFENGDVLLLASVDDTDAGQDGSILIQINEAGDSLDSYIFPYDSLHNSPHIDLITTSDGGAAILGDKNLSDDERRSRFREIIIKIAPEDNDVIDERWYIPESACLHPAFPNPFNSSTTISYELNEMMNVEVAVFDWNGQLVEVLDQGEKVAGKHYLTWNAEGAASGVYFVRLSTSSVKKTQKVLLVR
ncbi:T9SS type A sorting domain-containing protein [bacterium]|nr:T9SS type A sorting domain-containing protein [bacterium]